VPTASKDTSLIT